MDLEALADAELAELDAQHRLRQPRVFDGPHDRSLRLDGREVLSFSSNDYLGLAAHPALRAAAAQALEEDGLGAGASRLISGTQQMHREAEHALAQWLGRPATLLFSSGYAANVGALQTFLGRGDVVFSDSLNHASLIDGCRLSRAAIHPFRHRDTEHLAELLQSHRPAHRRALICSDALFSMDGDEARLHPLRALADEHDALLFVDEAHALGVLGPEGRGLCAEAGLEPDILVGTLGKALGLAGAFVASSPAAIRLLENRARSFVFSTATPPFLARTLLTAIELCRTADEARATLLANARTLRGDLAELGFCVPPGRSPIVPVVIGDDAATMALSERLLDAGVFVHGIRPPTVPPGTSRLRLTLMATHTDADLRRVRDAFAASHR